MGYYTNFEVMIKRKGDARSFELPDDQVPLVDTPDETPLTRQIQDKSA